MEPANIVIDQMLETDFWAIWTNDWKPFYWLGQAQRP